MNDDDTLMEALMSTRRVREATQESKDTGKLFALLLFALFVAALLMAIVAGTGIYRSLSQMQSSAGDARLGLNLVANSVRANDAAGSVAVGSGPEGRALVLVENLDSGSYETRIYLYQGSIVEEYALASAAYTPAKATKIVDSSTFDFTYSSGILTVTCDQGSVDIALRSVQGGV